MEIPKMHYKYPTKHFLEALDQNEPEQIRKLIHDPDKLKEFDALHQIWEEARHIKAFKSIDMDSDWNSVQSRLGSHLPLHYHKIPMSSYILKIAALFVLTCGLSLGLYKLILLNKESDTGFTQFLAEDHNREIILPDGSVVTLNSGSHITYREDFGAGSRDVILTGAAFFNVVPNINVPFRVYSGASMVEVTGTRFSVYEQEGKIQVNVLSGSVLLCAAESQQKRIAITANQSGYLFSNNELKIEKGIPANALSWKTGDLIFDQTPIDTALMDIARHFKRDLSIDANVEDKITAEFYDQPLHEILDEISLVAGLHFDTTGTALIVRK